MTPVGQTDPPPIRILILGPPVVTLSDLPIKINRRELRAGLFYLAGNIEPVSRSAICDLFWPKVTETIARKKLREGLSRLRSVLKVTDALITDNDSISLNRALVYSDFNTFYQTITPLLTSSELNLNGKLPDWCYSQLRKAIQLCRAPQFLEGFSMPDVTEYENWLAYTNHRYSISREKILLRLIDHSITIGSMNEAILWLEMAIETDPLNTDLNFLIINCLKDTGQTKEALSYLDLLESRYQSAQYDGLPRTLADIKERLQSTSTSLKGISIGTDWPEIIQEDTPFIGREGLIEALTNTYFRRGAVQINGETGSGKTRLVKEFYSRLGVKPRLFLCAAQPKMNSFPYSFLVAGLKSILTPQDWDSLPEQSRTELSPLLGSMGCADHPNEGMWSEILKEEKKQRLFDAILVLFEHLARQKPLLILVENAQWCDLPTLELLSFFNEKHFFKKCGFLILVTRKEERNVNLESCMDWSILLNNLEIIEIQPFSLEETTQLISMMLGKPAGKEIADFIWKKTGGNVLFSIEMFKTMQEEEFKTANLYEIDFHIPFSITSLVNKRIRFLSKPAEKTLIHAAVLGHIFEARALEEMVDLKSDEYLCALEELQEKCILKSENTGTDPLNYEFIHGIFRETILQNTSPARKRSLSLAAVKALQKVRGNSPELASRFAAYFEEAGEKLKAFDAWCAAARYSSRRFLKEDANAAYQKAAILLPRIPAEMIPDRLLFLMKEWGDYAYDLNDAATCRKIYSMGMEYGEANLDAEIIGASLNGIGRLAEMQGDFDVGIESFNRALFFLKKTGNKEKLLDTYSRLGFLFELKHDFLRAKATFQEGLKIKWELADKSLLDSVINLETRYSMLVCMMGYPSLAEEIAAKAVNESLLVHRQSARVQATAILATSQYYCGKYEKSLQNALGIYKLAVQLNLDRWIMLLDLILARNYLVTGWLDECWANLNHACKCKKNVVMNDLVLFGNAILGDIYRLLGNLPMAEEQYRRGAEQPLDNLQSLENQFLLGLTLCQRGQGADGLATMKDAETRSEALGLEVVSLLARVYASIWSSPPLDEERFNLEILPLVYKMKERGFGSGWWNVLIIRGGLALSRGDENKARESFIEAAKAAHDMHHRWIELWTLAELAEMKTIIGEERNQYRQRMAAILEEMAAHATKNPINTLFRKFYKGMCQNLKI